MSPAITWDPIAHAKTYRVLRGVTNDAAAATAIGATNSWVYWDTTVPSIQPFFYWVRAETNDAVSALSAADSGFRASAVAGGNGGATLNPPPEPAGNPVTAAKVALGNLNAQERSDLVAFFETLTDPRLPVRQYPFHRPTLVSESNRRPVLSGVGWKLHRGGDRQRWRHWNGPPGDFRRAVAACRTSNQRRVSKSEIRRNGGYAIDCGPGPRCGDIDSDRSCSRRFWKP